MNNSLVDFYCGGPEFGDMAAGKTVTTHATNMSTLGTVTGAITLTLVKGGTEVGGDVFGGGNLAQTTGNALLTVENGKATNLFGGSKSVADEDHVGGYAINGSVTLTGNAEIMGNVYGGGNKAAVEGNTGVKME